MRIATVLLLLAAPLLAGDNAKVEKARKAAEASPNDVSAWLALADALFEQEEYADAWEALEAGIAKNPNEARLSLKLGDTFVKLAEQEKAGGNDATTIVNYYLDAEKNYGDALKKDPKSAAALCSMANVNFETGREGAKERARELLSQCLGVDPNYAKAHALQGFILYTEAKELAGQDAKQKYSAAEEKYALALKLGDDDVFDMVRYGHTLLAQNKLDEARKAYLAALRKHPESNVPILSGLYHVANRGESKPSWSNPKLKPILEEAAKESPKSAFAWYYLGFCQSTAGETKEALDSFGNALAIDPKNPTYLFQSGYMHEKLGDETKALDSYRKALEAFPDQPQATERFYALVIAKAGDLERAEPLFEELVKLAPATNYVLNDYALLLRDWCEKTGRALEESPPAEVRRRLKRSGEVYEMAAAAAPDVPQILSDTGLLFWYYPCNFDADKAKGYLKRSLDLSDYSYLDAWNGLDKLCRKIADWETLADYAERVVGAMERGVVPTSPVGAGAPGPRPNEKAGMQARAEAALKLAQEKLKKS